MVTISGQFTFEDYLRAQRYHGRPRSILIAVIFAAMAFIVWLSVRDLGFPVFVTVYVLAIRPLYTYVRFKRQWEQTPSAHCGEKTYGLDETGFHLEDDEDKPCVTHWDKFLKSRESKHSFLLYLNPHMFVFLPKRLMSIEDLETTRNLLTDRIKQNRTV